MQLIEIFHELNQIHFSAQLPVLPLHWNTRMKCTAGRFSPKPMIEIASYLQTIENGNHHIRDTMLHEMIHYWLWVRKRPYGHTAEFYQKMRNVGTSRYNMVPIRRPYRYQYQCPACQSIIPVRKKLGNVACMDCCKKYNFGKYSKQFKLVLVEEKNMETKISSAAAQPITAKEILQPFHCIVEKLESIRDMIRNAAIKTNS